MGVWVREGRKRNWRNNERKGGSGGGGGGEREYFKFFNEVNQH